MRIVCLHISLGAPLIFRNNLTTYGQSSDFIKIAICAKPFLPNRSIPVSCINSTEPFTLFKTVVLEITEPSFSSDVGFIRLKNYNACSSHFL